MLRVFLVSFVLLTLAAIGIMVETPTGTIEGELLLQKAYKGKEIQFSPNNSIKSEAKVIAYGDVTRVSNVSKSGIYKFNNLPTGYYTLMYKANGYNSGYQHSVNVKEGKITKVKKQKLYFLSPSLSLSANKIGRAHV